MNAEHLYAIALRLQDLFKETKLLDKLQQLTNQTQSLSQNQNNPNVQQQVANDRENLERTLRDSPFEALDPSWKQTITELGGGILFNGQIGERVDDLFVKSSATPAAIVQGLNNLTQEIKPFFDSISQIITGFSGLKVNPEVISAGECEIGVMIPRAFVSNNLRKFSKETKELNSILVVFEELCTNSRQSFKINTISSSDFLLHLEAIPRVGACIARAVSFLVDKYKELKDIGEAVQKLRDLNVPSEKLIGTQEHADALMIEAVEKISGKLIEEFGEEREPCRSNEMQIEIKQSLKKLAHRIDHGFSISVRIGPPVKGAPDPENQEQEQYRQQIKAASPNLAFVKENGEPLLTLGFQQDEGSDSEADELEDPNQNPD